MSYTWTPDCHAARRAVIAAVEETCLPLSKFRHDAEVTAKWRTRLPDTEQYNLYTLHEAHIWCLVAKGNTCRCILQGPVISAGDARLPAARSRLRPCATYTELQTLCSHFQIQHAGNGLAIVRFSVIHDRPKASFRSVMMFG